MPSLQWASNKAVSLLNEFKDKGFVGSEWTFGWNRQKKTLGLCSYRRKMIYLSVYHVSENTEETVEDVIRHEIAHIIAGGSAGHGLAWVQACYITGAKPERCKESSSDVPSRYKGTCPMCGHVYKAHRLLKNMSRRVCVKKNCSARRLSQFVKWEYNTNYRSTNYAY